MLRFQEAADITEDKSARIRWKNNIVIASDYENIE